MSMVRHGVIVLGDGRYLMATVRTGRGGWRVSRVRVWQSSAVRNELLLGRGVTLGLRSHWSDLPAGAGELLADDGAPGVITCRTSKVEAEAHTEALARNVVGLVSEDALLVTIPRAVAQAPQAFLSVAPIAEGYAIGLVDRGKLRAVFKLAPPGGDYLRHHLGRAARYARLHGVELPETAPVFLIACEQPETDGGFVFHQAGLAVRSTAGCEYDDILKAAGVALAGGEAPRFGGATEQSAGRSLRAGLYGLAAGVICAVCTIFIALGVSGFRAERVLSERVARYQQVLAANTDVRTVMDQNREIAARILAIRGYAGQQTRWSELLAKLADVRRGTVKLDMLGSEPVAGDRTKMKIAFAGSAASERDVSTFIADLEKVPFLSGVSLNSLDKAAGGKAGFRIVCVLQLLK